MEQQTATVAVAVAATTAPVAAITKVIVGLGGTEHVTSSGKTVRRRGDAMRNKGTSVTRGGIESGGGYAVERGE